MARKSKWSAEDRRKLIKMVNSGVPEQAIREEFTTSGRGGKIRPMTAIEFAQQLKTAMVESGAIKQVKRSKEDGPRVYKVTSKGRLTVADFAEKSGAKPGDRFVLETPRGRSQSWRLLPYE